MALKKKKKNPLILPLLLVVLIAAVFTVYKVLDLQAKKSAGEDQSSSGVTMILERDVADVNALRYKYGGEDLSFVWDGIKGMWEYPAEKAFPLAQEPLTAMAGAISMIGVNRTLDTGDTGNYGFENPVLEVTVSFKDGTSRSFAVGDLNTVSGNRYLKDLDNGSVHMASPNLLTFFEYSLADLFTYDSLTSDIEVSFMDSAVLKTESGEIKIQDKTQLETLYAKFRMFNPMEYADWSGTEEAHSRFGIGTSSLTIHYRRAVQMTDASGNETTARVASQYSVRFGNVREDGKIPYVIDGSEVVYLADAAYYEELCACFGNVQ